MTTKKSSFRLKNIISVKEIAIIILVLAIIQWWQTRELLDSSGTMAAPTFTLTSLQGEAISYTGKENIPAVIYFFAPWCNICHLSIENLNSLNARAAENKIKIFIIALDWKNKEEVEAFVSEHDLPAQVLLGTQSLSQQYQIKGFPTYYLVDKQGLINSASMGYSTSLGLLARAQLL